MAGSAPRTEVRKSAAYASPGLTTNAVPAVIGATSTASGPLKPARKRRRVVISCTACHRRKQKCDRGLPCSNCVSRHVESSCEYESQPTAAKSVESQESSEGTRRGSGDDYLREIQKDSEAFSALGYSDATLGIFKRIDSLERDVHIISGDSEPRKDEYSLREKYKSLIRQLPARSYVDELVATFFREVNWQYSFLDRTTFIDYLQKWDVLSFEALNKGPQNLPRDLRFFPGLLFQVLALALQFQPLDYDPSLDSLKYVASMSFEDLANDYSESGFGVSTLLGKRDLTLVAVQIGLLRTSFLKNSGLITESWHCLGQTIRDAQECGLHKDSSATTSDNSEETLEAIWHRELRCRLWVNLSIWDLHMSLVLGRPHSIDLRAIPSARPVDVPIMIDRRKVAPFPRSETDPPTPLTMFIVNAEQLDTFKEIVMLEKEGPHPRDYSKVERVHRNYLQRLERLPAFFRSQNPDTTFDTHPDCYWLQAARPLMDTHAGFTIMALHRPYVFTIAKSRSEALKAGLHILRAQRRLFQYLQARHYKMFNLVLSTFDAVVLVAAIYILHPNENSGHLDDALQHFAWAMERFETMSVRNSMARAALGVLQAIHVRLLRSLEKRDRKENVIRAQPKRAQPLPSNSITDSSIDSSCFQDGGPGRGRSIFENSENPGVPDTVSQDIKSTKDIVQPDSVSHVGLDSNPGIQDSNDISLLQGDADTSGGAWGTYGNTLLPNFDGNTFDFPAMAPLQPTHDLIYNDLAGMTPTSESMAANAQALYDPTISWQFEGEFANDSFWNLMNQYNP